MKKITLPNIFNLVLFLFVLSLIFVPSVKATLLSGLMKVGLFSPNVENKIIAKAPENLYLQFINQNNETTTLQDFKNKVVFINIWATWCPPCRAEMPSIKKLIHRVENENVVFLFIDADANLADSNSWLAKNDYPFNNYIANINTLPKDWYKGALPTTLVLNKDGDLVYQHSGTANYDTDEFYQFITDLAK